MRLVRELQNTGCAVSKINGETALVCGLPSNYDPTVVAIVGGNYVYERAVLNLFVREKRLGQKNGAPKKALVIETSS